VNDPTGIPKLLKINQVAEILQVSRTSAYRLCQSGELPSVRFGPQTVRVRESDLVEYIESCTKNGSEHLNE
jgi:excisionase family DNA binding protein